MTLQAAQINDLRRAMKQRQEDKAKQQTLQRWHLMMGDVSPWERIKTYHVKN